MDSDVHPVVAYMRAMECSSEWHDQAAGVQQALGLSAKKRCNGAPGDRFSCWLAASLFRVGGRRVGGGTGWREGGPNREVGMAVESATES